MEFSPDIIAKFRASDPLEEDLTWQDETPKLPVTMTQNGAEAVLVMTRSEVFEAVCLAEDLNDNCPPTSEADSL
ncbi:hypothetical protein GW756_03005 [bacterium]|nr:hypothetical protein [bacterium]NCQ55513.1 hypothetical protein [Candidatus Parcubacteria bacterium]NCS67524.1 hypothetical protein [Candidatus Peregrinibacteria bacterium]NCS96311.1 hypothetical protein [bacterium]